MRLIDADALIAIIETSYKIATYGKEARNLDNARNLRDDVIEAIKETPTACQWISVKDRLPDNTDKVLIYATWNDYSISEICSAWYGGINGKWYAIAPVPDEFDDAVITHWMPLPEPPEEDDNAQKSEV